MVLPGAKPEGVVVICTEGGGCRSSAGTLSALLARTGNVRKKRSPNPDRAIVRKSKPTINRWIGRIRCSNLKRAWYSKMKNQVTQIQYSMRVKWETTLARSTQMAFSRK